MALYEVLATVAITLGLAIPVFMEKVMRPRYEERFEEFKVTRKADFIDELDKTVQKLKQSKDDLTEEIIDEMGSLYENWEEIVSGENELAWLIRQRKYVFIGCFVAAVLCVFSIDYSGNYVVQSPPLTLGQVAVASFVVMFLWSVYYGYRLFRLDEKLLETKAEKIGSSFAGGVSTREILKSYEVAEGNVSKSLDSLKIPYEKNAKIKSDDKISMVDFIIPSVEKPMYILEVKSKPSSSSIFRISQSYNEIKSQMSLKTILISDFGGKKVALKELAAAYWDYVVDFNELHRLKEIIKL